MVKKLKQMADRQAAAPTRLLDSALAGQVKESAQQIWLAGMGAFSRAQAEGSKVFEALVKEGATLQKKTQSAAEDKLNKMSSMAGDVQAKAGQHWDKLESIFEERTAKAMGKLGLPTPKEMHTMIARIDELSAKVADLSKGSGAKAAAKPKAAAKKAPAKKAAAKKATAKPAAKRAPAKKASAA